MELVRIWMLPALLQLLDSLAAKFEVFLEKNSRAESMKAAEG